MPRALGPRHSVTTLGHIDKGQRTVQMAVGFTNGRSVATVSTVERHNVRLSGLPDGQPMLFAHGFGCDQNMWRYVAPRFEADFCVILFDHVGAGESELSTYDPERYTSLDAYAEDVLAICRELDLRDVIFVGHSVSAMIGVLASLREPDRFAELVLVGPSPRYLNDVGYTGGFSEADIEELLTFPRKQLPGLVKRNGTGDHGQRRATRTGSGADGEFPQNRPAHCPAIRAGHIPLRQPGRSFTGYPPHPRFAMQ